MSPCQRGSAAGLGGTASGTARGPGPCQHPLCPFASPGSALSLTHAPTDPPGPGGLCQPPCAPRTPAQQQ